MANYKELKGKHILSIASDLDSSAGEGQIWFNTAGHFKTIVKAAGTWSSAGTLNTNQRAMNASFGVKSAAICVGGITTPGSVTDVVEQYNGSTWSEVGDINTARGTFAGAGGTSTSGLVTGGGGSPTRTNTTESWDNSSWTEIGDINTARDAGGGAGSSNTAVLIFAGNDGDYATETELWDGSSWSEQNDLSTARSHLAGFGTSTAALAVTGYNPKTVNVESWDGSSWTEVGNVNTARYNLGGGGIQTSGIIWAGNSPSIVTSTETYDGTSWTEDTDISSAGNDFGTGGSGSSQSSAIAISGSDPNGGGDRGSEEWDWSSTLVAGAWSSGGNLNNARNTAYSAQQGSYTAGMVAGGNSPGGLLTATELYDGSSWTASPASLPEACYAGASCGTQTAALQWKGATGSSGAAECFEFDGSSWTDGGTFPKSMQANAGTGTQTAALNFAGASPYSPITATYNGTAWTVESNNINTPREYSGGFGSQTAALCAGGGGGSPYTEKTECESWDGSSWTEGADLNTGRYSAGYAGDAQDDGMAIGNGPTAAAICEQWDGSSWTEIGDLSTGRSGGDGFGTTSNAVTTGGGISGSPSTNATEEWTGPSQNIKTIAD